MKRLMTIAAVLVIPASAWAQVPVPPTPPPAPVAPAPVIAPAPVPAPWVLNSLDVQEAMERARLAMDEQRVTMDSMKFDFDLQTTGARAAQAAQLAEEVRARAMVSMSGNAYDTGISLMSRRDYERAIVRFDQVIEQKAARADAALYHKAYALYRLGRGSDATAALASLKKDFPKSAYLKDASVLEAAVRESAGQPMRPEQADDDELKLLALNALQHSDPERALPLLEGVLNGANSLQLKQRAIFVLAQSTQPRARQILMDLAKGAGNPDLQRYAIRYVASGGKQGATTAELRAIYDSTQDADIKRAVIQALGMSGSAFNYVSAGEFTGVRSTTRTTTGAKPDNTAATQELLSIYQKEQDRELKRAILSRLGSVSGDKSGAMLTDLYNREDDVDTKKAIVSSLARQDAGEALVALARKETNMTLKRDIVTKLSTMSKNKAAMDYMLEIIK
jgi:tetratricopeptide (TPR) repeat protein